MSVYNAETFLREAIDSVLSQTFTDFEFLIYEDCSTDSSLEIIQSYSDPRIKLIKNESNRGLTWNLHDGMNTAKGEYVARMDADDICIPERFQKQVEFLDLNSDISVVGSAVIFFDEFGNEVSGRQPLGHEEIKVELLLSFTMLHPSVMMRVADFRKHGLNYNPHFRYSQDFDLWTRAIRILKFANHMDVLLRMREHSLKISRALKPAQKLFSDEIRESQYLNLGVKFTEKERIIINLNSSMIQLVEKNDLATLETAFNKVAESNHKLHIYKHELLLKKIRQNISGQHYQCLVDKNPAGLRLWKSTWKVDIRKNLKFYIKAAIRSVQTLLK